MELQAIRYAAMISAMTFSQAVEVYARYLKQNDSMDDAETSLLRFLEGDVAIEDFGRAVRIVLVSAEFSKEITTSVLWLNEHLDDEVDIRCVRLRPYALETRILLDVQQIVPLPEAEQYTAGVKVKAEEVRNASPVEHDSSKYDLTVDENAILRLPKRRLVFEVVKAALAKGFSPEQIAALVPPNKWISVDGELNSEKFLDNASKLQAKFGGKLRYFCDDGELFHIDGKTYALSNQWSLNTTIPVVDQVIAKLPPGTVSYAKTTEAD
jgi:hypothetical protein